MELGFKIFKQFFFVDSGNECIVLNNSERCHYGKIEHFDIHISSNNAYRSVINQSEAHFLS